MARIYRDLDTSMLFCFFVLLLRDVLVSIYFDGEATIDDTSVGTAGVGAFFYGALCNWIFRGTYLDNPNAKLFFLASSLWASVYFIGYMLMALSVQGGTILSGAASVPIVDEGIPHPAMFFFWVANPFTFMTLFSGWLYIKSLREKRSGQSAAGD